MQQQWTVREPWLNLHCSLGEGPFYESTTNSIRFVDIKEKKLHSVSVSEGPSSLRTLQLDITPSVTADIAGVDAQERILVGVKYGLAVVDRKTGAYDIVARFHDAQNERVRGNDGAADPHGHFWLGSMTDFDYGHVQPEGALFRFQGDKKEQVVDNLTIPNAIVWSPDSKTMYFTHSTTGQIFKLDYDTSTGAVSNKTLFYQHPTPGHPDGARVDVDGNLWTAVFGEAKVLRIDPRGEVTGEISLPTPNVTCVQFAGTELFITSAATDEDGDQYGGGLFRVDVGTRGLDLFKYRLP